VWSVERCCLHHQECYLLHAWLFSRETGDEMFLRNIAWLSTDYMTLHQRRHNSLLICVVDISRSECRNNGRFGRAGRAHRLQLFCCYSEASEVIKTEPVVLDVLWPWNRWLHSEVFRVARCLWLKRRKTGPARERLGGYHRSCKSAAAVIVSGVPWVLDGSVGVKQSFVNSWSAVVRVSGYRSRDPWLDSRPYQIFWEVGGLERGSLSLVRTVEDLLEWKSMGSGLEFRDQRPWDFVALTTQHPLPAMVGTNFVDKRRSLGRNSSLAD
jgi:hypothetical protein